MKQKTAKLQRWLDRLTAACENKKWSSAVAEADCLSAELKQVREELWNEAEKVAVPIPSLSARIGYGACFGARSFGIALLIICLSTIPIAVESGRPEKIAALPTGTDNKSEEFAIVTKEEKELLEMLRADMDKGSRAAVAAVKQKSPAPKKVRASKAAVRHSAPVPAVKAETGSTSAPVKKADSTIKGEDLLTLVQIGEKTLHGGAPAIKIVN